MLNRSIRRGLRLWVGSCALGGLLLGATPAAVFAQAIVTAVNGDPITTFDVGEHAKLLKLSHKPAGPKDALEAAIADRLKYGRARQEGLDASDSDIQSALAGLAASAKLEPDAWLQAAQKEKIDPDTIRSHLRALGAWDAYVRNQNKTLGISEEEIQAELARQGTNAKITDYDLRQVVFVLPVGASAAVIDGRMKDAQALRTRFTDCATGLQLARGMQDVAVKERMSRTSDTLSKALRTLLADVPSGHLTEPKRSTSGIEMVAVCNRSVDTDQTTLHDRVQTEVLNQKLQKEGLRMYDELRKTAVFSKP